MKKFLDKLTGNKDSDKNKKEEERIKKIQERPLPLTPEEEKIRKIQKRPLPPIPSTSSSSPKPSISSGYTNTGFKKDEPKSDKIKKADLFDINASCASYSKKENEKIDRMKK